MLQGLSKKLFGTVNERIVKAHAAQIDGINGLERSLEALSDEELRAKTPAFRKRIEDGETLDDLLVEAFAVTREAAKRTLGQRHYDVQLVGGIVLHQGRVAEMATGEGKTLVATLPVYLNALEGKGVHVITVNDYLAQRDAAWMGEIYQFLGLKVGCIVHGLSDDQRREQYGADVTYGTNNEFGFDYLRDNMKFTLETMVQRPFNFAIVDEVDSILIDEARTPLIISGPSEDSSEMYQKVDQVIPELLEGDFEIDEKARAATLTDEGAERVEAPARQARPAEEPQPLRHRERLGRAPPEPGGSRPQDVRARHRLHRERGPRRHHRRVHRAHDAGPPLLRRAAPGARGQGARAGPAGEPDAGLDHLPELLPHVSEARRHDRHRGD